MNNKVYLDKEDIITIEVVGDQTVESVQAMGRQINALITELKSLGKPVLSLDNLLQMGKVNSDARKTVVELGKQLDVDRLAMLGKGGALRFGANLMLHATGRGYKMRYFDDHDEALTWLHQKEES